MDRNGNELGNGQQMPPMMFGGGGPMPQMQMPAGMGIPMLQSIPGLSVSQHQQQQPHPGFAAAGAGMMPHPGMGTMMPGMHQPHPGFAGLPQMPAGMVLPAAMATPQQLGGVGMAMSGGGLVGSHQSDLLSAKPSPAPKFKKAPDAPKRFKSAFIIFSAEKHKLIKEELAKEGRAEKTTDIAKLVSEAWRQMDPEEKESWETMARKDKARYEVEKALYRGPWKVPANKRTPKDPTAPKRPMSAFLAFSNKRRAALKRENPDATNADLSKMLSKTWKHAEDELRKKYMDEEADLRAKYKISMAAWRKKVAEEKRQEREEREAVAMKHAEAQQSGDPTALQQGQQQQQQPLQVDSSQQQQQAVDQSQLLYPYMAQMGNLLAGGTGGMPGATMGGPMGTTDPSQQYANMVAANNAFAAAQQQQFSFPQQQQLLNQLFTQQLKYPNMNGVPGMYPGMQGQFVFQGQQAPQQQQQPMGMPNMSPPQGQQQQQQQGQMNAAAMQQQQAFVMQQQLQQQLAMAQAMQQQQQPPPMMDHHHQQQQQEAMMMAQQQQMQQHQYHHAGMQFHQGDDDEEEEEDDDDNRQQHHHQHHGGGGGDHDDEEDDDDDGSVKDDDTPSYGVSL